MPALPQHANLRTRNSPAEAVKFVGHRDGMVRTAVKTLTLNVFGIPLPAVQRFVTQPPASAYLEQLGALLAEQCQVARQGWGPGGGLACVGWWWWWWWWWGGWGEREGGRARLHLHTAQEQRSGSQCRGGSLQEGLRPRLSSQQIESGGGGLLELRPSSARCAVAGPAAVILGCVQPTGARVPGGVPG